MTAAPASPPPDGYDLDARYVPLLGVSVILNVIGPTTLCAIHPHRSGVRGFWLEQSTTAAAEEWVEQYNLAGHNIYFVLNLPRYGLSKKPRKAEIVELRGLAADIDAKNGRSLNDAFALIGNVGIKPNLIIASGGGFQPIFKLTEPLPASDENIRRVEAAGARIVRLTGSDRVQSSDHIFRVPFTTNFPDEKKRAAGRVVCCSGLLLPNAGDANGQPSLELENLV